MLAFSLWTLCCHAVVAATGSLWHLIGLYTATAAVAATASLWLGRRLRFAPPDVPPAGGDVRLPIPAQRGIRAAGLAGGLAVSVLALHGEAGLWWGGLLTLGVAAAAFLLAEAPHFEPAVRSRGFELALWGLAAACVAVALVTHRPDLDDTFYINAAVAAADVPSRALWSGDTLLGIEGLPLYIPAHRLHSYELANAALSLLTGIPAIHCFHWISASLAALLVPLALAALFRLLTPRDWPFAVAATLVVLVAAGEAHRWYGNFALVRIWQGKAIYLFVFMPLIYAYALRFALQPRGMTWLGLAAAQIAAVGCSSSAIWAAPAGAWLAMSAALRPDREGLRRFALGALTSVYPLGAGLLLRGEMQTALAEMLSGDSDWPDLPHVLGEVLGNSRLYTVALASTLAGWALCPSGLARRFAIAVPLGVWLVLLNPYARDWVAANLTGPSYWRSLWSLPVPVLMALALTSPLQLRGRPVLRAAGVAAGAAALVAFALWIPRYSALSQENGGADNVGIRVGMPGLKVPDPAYRWAKALNDSVPAGSTVVAPPRISAWVPTFHAHAYPVLARLQYMVKRVEFLVRENVDARRSMTAYVAGKQVDERARQTFAWGLDAFDVKGVCLRNSKAAPEARRLLESAGFSRKLSATSYEIWVR